jgi:hypothetical protein
MTLSGNDTYIGTVSKISGAAEDALPRNSFATWQAKADDITGIINVQLHFTVRGIAPATREADAGRETIEIWANTPSVAMSNVSSSLSWDQFGVQVACQMRGLPTAPSYTITYCDPGDTAPHCKSDGTCPMWPAAAPMGGCTCYPCGSGVPTTSFGTCGAVAPDCSQTAGSPTAGCYATGCGAGECDCSAGICSSTA